MAPKVNAVAAVLAAVRSKVCVLYFAPPAISESPKTSSILPMIEPVIDALTTPSNPLDNANSAMINSAALPNVAFSKPPIPCPRWFARCSVALPIQPASGIIAKPAQIKSAVGFSNAGIKRSAIEISTNIKSQSSDGLSHDDFFSDIIRFDEKIKFFC